MSSDPTTPATPSSGSGVTPTENSRFNMAIPKLAPPAHINWFSFKNRLVTCLRFYGINDPGSASLTSKQQALLYGVLAEALDQSNESYLMDKDNEELHGSVAYNNCCTAFETVTSTHKAATIRLYLAQRNAASSIQTEADMDAWCNEVIRLQNNVLSAKVLIDDFLSACFLDFLPKSPEWLTFVVNNTNSEKSPKPMEIVVSAKRHFRTVLETNRHSGVSSTHGAIAPPVVMQSVQQGNRGADNGNSRNTKQECTRCGGKHPTAECRRSKDHTCKNCGKTGHFEKFCRSKTSKDTQQQPDNKPEGTGPGYGRTAFGVDTNFDNF
jgi:hypothetical protein